MAQIKVPVLKLPQKCRKTLECDLKRKLNNLLHTGNPINDTFINSGHQDEIAHSAAFYQGLHCLLGEILHTKIKYF